MKIIIEVENRTDFDHHALLEWMNRWLSDVNGALGSSYYAHYIGTEGEDDETD